MSPPIHSPHLRRHRSIAPTYDVTDPGCGKVEIWDGPIHVNPVHLLNKEHTCGVLTTSLASAPLLDLATIFLAFVATLARLARLAGAHTTSLALGTRLGLSSCLIVPFVNDEINEPEKNHNFSGSQQLLMT